MGMMMFLYNVYDFFQERRKAKMDHWVLLFSIFILLVSQTPSSRGWLFSSSKEAQSNDKFSGGGGKYENAVSEFSMAALNDRKGVQLVEKAKNKMRAPNTCWQTAYQNVFEGCAKTLADEEKRSRLAWHLSDCFQRHTGRPPFPYCDPKSTATECLKKLDKGAHTVFLEYFLETNSICHQLQWVFLFFRTRIDYFNVWWFFFNVMIHKFVSGLMLLSIKQRDWWMN